MTENIGIRLSLSGAQAVQSGLAGVNKELGGLQSGALRVADALRGVGAALVAGLSVGAISAWTRATVNALDAFNDVADATGASIESLSRLEAVALRTGGSFDTVAGALVKLNQQLAAAKPDNEAGIALKMIGLEAEALRRIDPADALREVAVALAQFESDGNKARVVQELFGKSIREVAPLLNDLAEAGDISATVTAKQVAEAEKFNKQLAQLSANLTQTARSVTSDFLPAINGLLERVNQIDDNKLQRFIDRLLTLGSPAFAVVLRQIQGAVSSVANSVAALPSAGAGAVAPVSSAPQRQLPRLGAVDDVLKRQRAASEASTAALKAQQAELELFAKRALKTMEAIDAAEEAANKALAEDARQLAANSLRRIEAVDEAEAAVEKSLQTAQQMVEAITRETEQLQMSNVEREVSVALLELERAGLERGTYAYDEYARKIREAVVSRENVRESIERQRTIAADYQRMSDQVGQALTTALMEGGKNAADYIQGVFRSMVLRPVIQAVVGTALGMAPSGMGGGGGGAGSPLSTLSALNTAYSAITRGFASVGATVSESLLRAGDYLATSSNNMLASSGEWLQGVSQGAGTIAASIAGAAAGYFARNAISRGFSMGRGMDTVQNIAVAVGSYINPVLGAVVGAVSGLLNRAFGRRLRDQGIRGTFGGEAGFVGENFQAFDGGWFRSDSTRTSELDAGTQRGLANAFRQLQLNMAQMAAILNRPTMTDLVDFTRNIEISLQGLTDEQAAQALQTELTAVAEALAEAALGTGMFTREGETAVATLERLSRSLLSVNAIFDTLGLQAYVASLSGADMASQLADTAGGLENLSNLTTAYYETFYSEAERAATTTRQVGEALGNMGLQMPATRDAFRALVEAQDLTTQSGRATFVALLNLAPAFAEVVGAAEDLAGASEALRAEQQRLADVARERAGLERALLELQGDTAALRALDLAALDESNRALQEQIWALGDLEQAAQQAAAAEEALAREREAMASDRARLERELLSIAGDTAALRALDLSALDASNRALQEQIWAIGDMRDALERARESEAQRTAAIEESYEASRRATDAALQALGQAIDAARQSAAQALRDQFNLQQQAIDAQIETASLAVETAREQVSTIRQVLNVLKSDASELRNIAGRGMASAQGLAFLEQSIRTIRATGYLPETEALSQAIGAARGGLESDRFSTAVDFRRAQARLSITLDTLSNLTESQLGVAQTQFDAQVAAAASLEAIKDQAKAQFDAAQAANTVFYDAQLFSAEAQVAELRRLNVGVLSVEDATLRLAQFIAAESRASAALDMTIGNSAYQAQVAAAQAQLSAAYQQLGALQGINNGVISLSDAMNRLAAALRQNPNFSGLDGANTGPSQAPGGNVTTSPSTGNPSVPVIDRETLLLVSPEMLLGQYNATVGSGVLSAEQFIEAQRQSGVSDAQLIAANYLRTVGQGSMSEAQFVESSLAAGLSVSQLQEAQRLLLSGSPRFSSGAAFLNSVVHRPSAFPLGIMGEAGPEAIMPLSRGPNGALGVRSFGGDALIAEIQGLRNELEGLRAEARATASHTAKTARILDRVTPDGNSLQTVPAP